MKHGWTIVGLGVGLLFCIGRIAWPAEDESRKDHGQNPSASETSKPEFESYSKAMSAIQEHREKLAAAIKAGDPAAFRAALEPIRTGAGTLAGLAARPDSGIPPEQAAGVESTANAIVAALDKIASAKEAGNQVEAEKAFSEFGKSIQALPVPSKPAANEPPPDAAPAYACPMRCEGDKIYPAPGKCPKCGMELQRVEPKPEGTPAGGHDHGSAGMGHGMMGCGMMKHGKSSYASHAPAPPPPPPPAPPPAPVAHVAKPYPIDTCLVSGSKLGAMGTPPSIVYKGQEIKFCCASCIGEFQKDPANYLWKLPAETSPPSTPAGPSR
ncbi:MAG: heavy metal-binding domain-containing protein [Planctomycetota bacterium]